MQDHRLIRAILAKTKSVAVLGARDNPGRPVDMVGRYMLERGFTLFPVHPVRKSVWDIPAVKTVLDLPQPVDLVLLFRAPEHCLGHAHECLAMPVRAKWFWMQSGIRSPEARTLLEPAGFGVIEDRCFKVEHERDLP